MASRDEDFGADLALTEGNDAIWSPSGPAPGREARDWRSLYEQAHARAERECSRADAAEARAEELRWAEVDARGRAGSLKWQLDRCRNKLKAAVEETKDVRRTAKNALSLQAEVTRLEKLLSEASIEPAKGRPIAQADTERRRLRAGLERAENQKATIESLRAERGELRKEVTRLNREVARLGKRLAREEQASERHKETIRRQYDEDIQLRATLKRLREQSDRVRSLSDEVFWLRLTLDGAKAGKEAMKVKLARLLAEKRTLSRPIAGPQLRAALRRSWRQKQTIKSQSKEIRRLRRAVRTLEAVKAQAARHRAARETLTKALSDRTTELRVALRRSRRQKNTIRSLSKGIRRLRKIAKASQTRIEKLEAQYVRLRASASVLQKALFGSRSEQQEKPRSERKRGQQRGAPGHGRTQRPALEEKAEHHNPPKTARLCSCCGKPYVANGENSSTVIEIEVEAHTRRIVRPRWRRGCDCASSPLEVSAPPVPRLFPRTPYGTSVWACFLYERYACLRPLAPGLRMDVGPGAADLGRDAGRQRASLRAPVRAGGRGDPHAPEPGCGSPWRRDHLAHPVAEGNGPIEPCLVVDLGERRRGLLPHRPVPQRQGRHAVVRRHGVHSVPGLRPSLVLQDDGARTRWRGDSVLVLGAPAPRLHPRCGRSGRAGALVPEVDRTNRVDLQAERGQVGALRPRSRAPDGDVRAPRNARWKWRSSACSRTPSRNSPSLPAQERKAKAAALAAQPSQGLSVFVDKPFVPMDNNRGKRAPRTGDDGVIMHLFVNCLKTLTSGLGMRPDTGLCFGSGRWRPSRNADPQP